MNESLAIVIYWERNGEALFARTYTISQTSDSDLTDNLRAEIYDEFRQLFDLQDSMRRGKLLDIVRQQIDPDNSTFEQCHIFSLVLRRDLMSRLPAIAQYLDLNNIVTPASEIAFSRLQAEDRILTGERFDLVVSGGIAGINDRFLQADDQSELAFVADLAQVLQVDDRSSFLSKLKIRVHEEISSCDKELEALKAMVDTRDSEIVGDRQNLALSHNRVSVLRSAIYGAS